MALEEIDDLVRDSLIGLCEEAIAGELSQDAFYARWPGAAESELLSEIHDDLEDGVEHYPGHWRSGRPLSEEWKTSEQCWRLRVDAALLRQRQPASVLARCRNRLIRLAGSPESRDLDKAVIECLNSAEERSA